MKRNLIVAAATTLIGSVALAQTDADNFYKSNRVNIEKVSFTNQYKMKVAGNLFLPKDMKEAERRPAIIVGHPMGAVKEQSANLYATKMAERGFVTLSIDLSFWGESDGEPRNAVLPEIYAEAFSAAVDFLGTRPFVNRDGIGAIGICGSGSFAISAAKIDPRLKAVATVSMYDMGTANRSGLGGALSLEQRKQILAEAAAQRYVEFEGGTTRYTSGSVHELTDRSNPVEREFYQFYRTPRGEVTPAGATPQTTTHPTLTSNVKFMNFYPFADIETISPRPLLFIAGETAHSREFSEEAYRLAAEPKQLLIVPNAGHVDLYDRTSLIPFDRLETFFKEYLNKSTLKKMNEKTDPILGLGEPVTDNFTGEAWLRMLSSHPETYDCTIYNVTFAPLTRNYWHAHSEGQILICTEGVGYYQQKGKPAERLEPGVVVHISAGTVHWHGAAPDSRFTHIGITPKASQNKVDWIAEVTDEEYYRTVKPDSK